MAHVTIDQLKTNTVVTDGQLALECSEEHLRKVAKKIGNYLPYATALGLEPAQITRIEQDIRIAYDSLLKTERVLLTWKGDHLSDATYLRLVNVARELGEGTVARYICELCREREQRVAVPDPPANQEDKEISLYNLTNELGELTDPIQFGIHLKIPQNVMTRIETTYLHPIDIDGQKKELFKYIASNHKTLKITWTTIVDALSKTRHGDLSLKIREKYC